MHNKLFPSMMCANLQNLEKVVTELDEAKVDGFHIDIMDGRFVPNFGMGIQDLKVIRQLTSNVVDVHLMIKEPGRYIDLFSDLGANTIYIHPESELNPARTIQKIKDLGIKAGIAINPDISIFTIEPLLSLVDIVLIMTVNPGFSGQKYLNFVNGKIKDLLSPEYKQKYDYEVYVDGAISPEKISYLSSNGVNGFILGTSSLFGKEGSYREIIGKLK
ncbi:ribulose-phosphate 3-epimerase [Staphylococcus cohnii]|uniref:ribulose-phosphate 3-epimerase n=1 Tax=Staphylococcus cohnii TaxID=29382 RepID=UPI003D7E5734